MANVQITPINLRSKTTVIRNNTSASPAVMYTDSSDRSYQYFMRSIRDSTWGLLLSIPGILAPTARTIYWYDDVLSTSMELAYRLSVASVTNKLFLAYNTSGPEYVPSAESTFTGATVTGGIYVHLFKVTDTTYKVTFTDNTAEPWDESLGIFTSSGSLGSLTIQTYSMYAVPGTSYPNSELMNGTLWSPPLDNATEIDTTATTSTLVLPCVSIANASSINAHLTNTNVAAKIAMIDYKVHYASDTKELIIPLATNPSLTYPPEFHNIKYLPLFFGGLLPSKGSFAPNAVKLTPVNAADQTLFSTIGGMSTINILFDNTKHLSISPSSIVDPTIVIDIAIWNYIGFKSDTVISYFGIPAYIYMPAANHRTSIILRMVDLPYTFIKLKEPIVVSPPDIEDSLLWRGGSSQPGNLSGGDYILPVKSQFGWSAVAKDFDMSTTGASFRLTCTPASVLDASTLQAESAGMSLKVGVFNCTAVDVRMQYREPGYALDFRPDDPIEFFYIELSKINDTISVTSHAHSVTTQPGNATVLTAANVSGKTIDWAGTTQLDILVTKSTVDPTKATLVVYIDRYKAAVFTVPWINSGTIMYFGTNRLSYTGTSNMFTLMSPSETINVTEPLSGVLVPPPPTQHNPIQITSELVTTSAIQTDPNVVYYHAKGATADLYIPYLTGTDPTSPTGFAVIRNFPHLSGSTYEKIVNQAWSGPTYLQSYMIDTTDTLQFPSTSGINVGILYTHNPTNSGPYQVTLRTGAGWTTVIGTYTAEPTSTLSTYRSDPYPNLAIDMLSKFSTGLKLYSSRVTASSQEVTLVGGDATGVGSGISVAYSVANNDAFSITFHRTSIGLYLESGYFDIMISSVRKEHVFKVDPSGNNLVLTPYPNIQMLRIRMSQNSEALPVVQVSNKNDYTYTNQIQLNSVGNFSPFDGTRKITIGFEKVGINCILHLYQDSDRVASAAIPFTYPKSGQVVFFHSNDGSSTETIRLATVSSGKGWLGQQTDIPLNMIPTITRAVTGPVSALVDTTVYQLDQDIKAAFCDIYIHNSSLTLAAVTVSVGSSPMIPIARNVKLSAGKTLCISAKYLTTNEVISVYSTVGVRVRVAVIGELKTY